LGRKKRSSPPEKKEKKAVPVIGLPWKEGDRNREREEADKKTKVKLIEKPYYYYQTRLVSEEYLETLKKNVEQTAGSSSIFKKPSRCKGGIGRDGGEEGGSSN